MIGNNELHIDYKFEKTQGSNGKNIQTKKRKLIGISAVME
jgi:hypothetical protein